MRAPGRRSVRWPKNSGAEPTPPKLPQPSAIRASAKGGTRDSRASRSPAGAATSDHRVTFNQTPVWAAMPHRQERQGGLRRNDVNIEPRIREGTERAIAARDRQGRTVVGRLSVSSPTEWRGARQAEFVIEHREALIYALCQAAELEHGIMCQYLFAAFSLKQSAGEGLTEAEAGRHGPLAPADLPCGHPGDAAPGAGAQPALGDRGGTAPGAAEPAAAREPLPGGRAARADPVRRAGAAALHVPGTARRAWTLPTPRAWRRSGRRRRC